MSFFLEWIDADFDQVLVTKAAVSFSSF